MAAQLVATRAVLSSTELYIYSQQKGNGKGEPSGSLSHGERMRTGIYTSNSFLLPAEPEIGG
jgi:hypothetical protein